MNNSLSQVITAIELENWSLTNEYLKQIILDTPTNSEEILNIALTVLKQGDFQNRWDVAKLLPKFGYSVIDPLMAILTDEEADIDQRWFAGRILGEFNHPEVIASLVNLLKTTADQELREITAASLANLGSAAIEVLSPLLLQSDTRYHATEALARIRCSQAITPLLSVVDDDNIDIRATAIEALSSFRDPRVLPILINALQDQASKVRKEAVIGLGLRKDLSTSSEILIHLQPLLYDFNLEVCQQTAIAIGRLKTDAAASILFKVLQSPTIPIPLQITVIQSLGWMESANSLNYLQLALPQMTPEGIIEIIRILGRIENPKLQTQASKILLNFFYSQESMLENIVIKKALAYSWGQLKATEAKEALSQLAEDTNASVRLHAQATLKQLTQLI